MDSGEQKDRRKHNDEGRTTTTKDRRQKEKKRRQLCLTMSKTKPSIADCDRPSCDDMVSMLQAAQDRSNQKPEEESCPPTKPALGQGSWMLLHTMAAWYPDDPTDKDREHMTGFMAAFARFYPCTWCAKDFATNLQKKPVQTASRKDVCQWLCE
jgi:FAD-linked sulfhydryl oxidase